MNEQRRQILEMLAAGKVSADEADRLIAAVEPEPVMSPQGSLVPVSKSRAKYLRVVVESASPLGEDGASDRINIRVPLQLLRAGVRLASLIPPRAITRINDELSKAGVPIDLAELKPQQLEEIVDHLDDVLVDIEDPDSKVQVFCE